MAKTPQLQALDSALRVALAAENLDGTKWAIQKIRDAAGEANGELTEALEELAARLDGMLDLRAVQLTMRT